MLFKDVYNTFISIWLITNQLFLYFLFSFSFFSFMIKSVHSYRHSRSDACFELLLTLNDMAEKVFPWKHPKSSCYGGRRLKVRWVSVMAHNGSLSQSSTHHLHKTHTNTSMAIQRATELNTKTGRKMKL